MDIWIVSSLLAITNSAAMIITIPKKLPIRILFWIIINHTFGKNQHFSNISLPVHDQMHISNKSFKFLYQNSIVILFIHIFHISVKVIHWYIKCLLTQFHNTWKVIILLYSNAILHIFSFIQDTFRILILNSQGNACNVPLFIWYF